MKKLFTLFAMMFLLVGGLFAQKLSYQAVVRDNDNKLVVNTALTVEVSILNANNGVQYAETHNATSNQNGLIVLTIGEGTVTSGTNLSAVNWEGATIESVIKNGSATVATISSPVNAVPYALQAANASGSFSQVQADWNETNTASKAYIVNKPDLSVFITTETDPTVPAWAKETTKPVYQYSEIQNTPTIPTTVASLTDAADYAKVADMNTALGAKADTAAVKAALNGKADANNVYTKAETDNLLGDKADAADLAAKANTSDIHNSTITINQNGALVGSFTLNQAGDQTINLAGGGSGGTGVAQTLNLNGNTLSLTPNGGSVTLPAETDPTVPAWAKTANKPVYNYSEIQNKPDLEGYATTTAMNEALALKANAADVYTKTEVNDALALKANAADMATALDAKADKTAMNDALALKANAADVYTKTEMNTALNGKADTASVYTRDVMNTKLAGKADNNAVFTKDETKDAISDSLDNIRAQMAALSTQMSNLMTALNALQVTTEKFIATAGQTSFTLTGTPNGNVVMYVNGVMVGSTVSHVISVSGTTGTYHPSYNYSYTLQAGDVVTFMYVVRANN